jgi:hypothetical protein
MIRFLLRSLGLLLVAIAFFFFVYDGTRWIANGQLAVTSVEFLWNQVNQTSLQHLQSLVQHDTGEWLQRIVQAILKQPVWVVLVIVGAILMLLGRKKKPLIGYAR